jgi:hypothetical protein
MLKRGLASPDDGDALALTFGQPVAPLAPEEPEERRPSAGSATAAVDGCAEARGQREGLHRQLSPRRSPFSLYALSVSECSI